MHSSSHLSFVLLLFTMAPALLISFAVYSAIAILMAPIIIYHDISDNVYSDKRRERGVAVLLEICQIGLLVTSIYAVTVDVRLSNGVVLYDAVVLSSLQLSVGNNVWPVLLLIRLC